MSSIKFPPLKADQVECRVGTVTQKGCSILLYKTARTDMDILDEVVGPERWQNEFFDAGGKLFCRLSIKIGDEWISKSDCGVEGSVGEEKSQASDARKRAGFAWGIGRELYNSPFVFLTVPTVRGNDGRYRLESYPRLKVTEFESDGRNVTSLVICNDKGTALFRHGNALKEARKVARPAGQATPSPAEPHIMTKEEFRTRWNSDDQGGGITFDDIADCAKAWGIYSKPKTHDMYEVRDDVLKAAGCSMPDDEAVAAAVDGVELEGDPFANERKAFKQAPLPPAPVDDNLAIALDELKRARNREELREVNDRYKAIYGKYAANPRQGYIDALNEMARRFPRNK